MPANKLLPRFSAAWRPVSTLLATCLLLALSGCQTDSHVRRERPDRTVKPVHTPDWGSAVQKESPQDQRHDIWERIRRGYKLQDAAGTNPRIEQQRIGFVSRAQTLQQITERSTPYIHYVVERLEANDMPLELALLPMIESSYDPLAYSPARAAGLWQFIPSTGLLYNLRQNSLYDGRRDITASTDAAITYLKRLHDLFNGDWLLALAAYNAGEGSVSRAIERNEQRGLPTDYWNLPLPGETRDYVPRLLAVSQIIQTPEAYGITLANVLDSPYFERVEVPAHIDLGKVAAASDVDEKELLKLNPAFKQRITPEGTTHLLVPVDKVDDVSETLDDSKVKWLQYTVVKGDTLPGLASRFHVSISALRDINKLGKSVSPGVTLRIPEVSESTANQMMARLQYEGPAEREREASSSRSIKVKKGETLSSIARRNGVSVRDLQRWNGLKGNTVKPGQMLAIKSSAPAKASSERSVAGKTASGKSSASAKPAASRTTSYKVRSGDTIASIARRFSVSMADVRSWNPGLKNNLKPGQSVTIKLPR